MSRRALLIYCLILMTGLLIALALAVIRDAASLWLPLGLGALYFGMAARGEFLRLRAAARMPDRYQPPSSPH